MDDLAARIPDRDRPPDLHAVDGELGALPDAGRQGGGVFDGVDGVPNVLDDRGADADLAPVGDALEVEPDVAPVPAPDLEAADEDRVVRIVRPGHRGDAGAADRDRRVEPERVAVDVEVSWKRTAPARQLAPLVTAFATTARRTRFGEGPPMDSGKNFSWTSRKYWRAVSVVASYPSWVCTNVVRRRD